jgi:hypothetical protein
VALEEWTRLVPRYLLGLLDKLGGATIDLPTPNEVVDNAQDKDESEDGT